jgi:hypothetical protein
MKLAGLKLTAVKQPLNVSDEHVRRNKIVKRLIERNR